MAEPITNYIITAHAMREIEWRRIDEDVVRRVLSEPEQRECVREGRDVL